MAGRMQTEPNAMMIDDLAIIERIQPNVLS